VLNFGHLHKYSPAHTLGATVKTDLSFSAPKMQVGGEYKINAYNTLKYKFDLPDGVESLALEHRLANPSVSVGLAASFKPLDFASAVKAQNFGVTLTFGDY